MSFCFTRTSNLIKPNFSAFIHFQIDAVSPTSIPGKFPFDENRLTACVSVNKFTSNSVLFAVRYWFIHFP